jgi:hypothetical protein
MSDEFFSQIPGYVFVETGEGGYWSYNPAVAAKQKADAEAEAARLEASKYRPGMKTSDLEQMAKIAPFVTYRTVEGGEGSRQEAISNDPAQLANKLLAQPEKVSADYIRTTYPSLSQLPASVLNQMGQDWRTAYAHLYKATEPSSSGWYGEKQGFVPVPIRLEGGKPFLSTGGGGELFAEALPYVQYSPEYGFGVAQQGVRPYQDKMSVLDFVGAAAPGIVMAAALGPAGLGLSLPAAGAVSGGINALLNDQNIVKGAITGGALGGLGQIATPAVSSALNAAGITGAAQNAITSAAINAGRAAITGGDVAQAALAGAAGSAAGSALGSLDILKDIDPGITKAITAAATGAARAAVTGGDPVQAALSGAINSGTSSLLNGLKTAGTLPSIGETPKSIDVDEAINQMLSQQDQTPIDWESVFGPTQTATAGGVPDILAQLEQQETAQQSLYSILSGQAAPLQQTTIAGLPEQQGLLPGDYKQETTADELKRLAESALGAVIPSAQATGQDRVALVQPEKAEGVQPADYKYFFDWMAKPDPDSAYAGLSAEEKAAVDRASQEFAKSSPEQQAKVFYDYRAEQLNPPETSAEWWISQGNLQGAGPTDTTQGAGQTDTLQDLLDSLGSQQQQQAATEAAVQKALGTSPQVPEVVTPTPTAQPPVSAPTSQPSATSVDDILSRLTQQSASQQQLEQALRGEFGTGFGTLEGKIIAESEAQSAQQRAMQEALQAQFGSGMSDLERQIMGQAAADEADRAAMQKALEDLGMTQEQQQQATQQQIGQVQTGLGQQITGLGKSVSDTIAGLAGQFGSTTQGLQQQIGQAQQQAGFGNLLGMLGLMQQQKKETPPIPLVGEITPYNFSTDLLEGIYKPAGQYNANSQLLNLVRGK